MRRIHMRNIRRVVLIAALAVFAACTMPAPAALAGDGGEKEKKEAVLKDLLQRMEEAKKRGDFEEFRKLRDKYMGLKDGGEWGEAPAGPRPDQLKEKMRDLAAKIDDLRAQREKALEEFDVEKVDELSRKIAELERMRENMEREAAKGRGSEGESELFKKLSEAEERGDSAAAERIRQEINRIRRGAEAGRPAAAAAERLGKVAEKLDRMAREAEKAGDAERAESVGRVRDGFKDLVRQIGSAKTQDEIAKIAAAIKAIAERGHKDLKDAEEKGDAERAEILRWLLGEVKAAHEILSQAGKRPGEVRLQDVEQRIEDMKKKAEALEAEGRHDEARALREEARALFKAAWERKKAGPEERGEGRENRMREFREKTADLARRIEEAEAAGDRGQAEELRDKLRRMKEEFAEGAGVRKAEKDAGRGAKAGDRLKRLRDELEKAEMEGDSERAEKIREKIRREREESGRAGPGEPREGVEKPSKEAAELRQEIDRLRKELAELKQLLMELLKEREKD